MSLLLLGLLDLVLLDLQFRVAWHTPNIPDYDGAHANPVSVAHLNLPHMLSPRVAVVCGEEMAHGMVLLIFRASGRTVETLTAHGFSSLSSTPRNARSPRGSYLGENSHTEKCLTLLLNRTIASFQGKSASDDTDGPNTRFFWPPALARGSFLDGWPHLILPRGITGS